MKVTQPGVSAFTELSDVPHSYLGEAEKHLAVNVLETAIDFVPGGNVVGPTSSTDNAIARYDGITGKLIQDSGVFITDTGSVGVGTGTPASALEVQSASTAKMGLDTYRIYSKNISSFSVTSGDFANVFTFTQTSPGGYNGSFIIQMSLGAAGISQSKTYFVNYSYDGTDGAWMELLPITSSGPYFPGGEDIVMDVNITNAVMTIRVRRVSGTKTANINVTAQYATTTSTIALVDSETTGSGATVTGFFPGTPLTQVSGNIGIGTRSPGERFDIVNGNIGVTGGNLNLEYTTNANQYGIINKNGYRYLHDFNYGNNGVVTTIGQNLFIGLITGNLTMGSTATANTEASYNTAIGYNSFASNTTGHNNTAIGRQSLSGNTTGYQNLSIGSNSMTSNTTGFRNTAIGFQSLQTNVGGSIHVAIGRSALLYCTGGYNNTAVGGNSGWNPASDIAQYRITTDNNMTLIGYGATKDNASAITNGTAIGSGAKVTASNTVVIGNTSVTGNYFQGILDTAGDTLRVRTSRTPASASATGNAGDICWDADYIYVCTATDTWKRTAIATW